jgi:hypothetical protein
MTKNIKVAVVGYDLETLVVNAIPLIEDLSNFEYLSFGLVPKRETERSLIRLVPGVTLDLKMYTHSTSLRGSSTLSPKR